MERVVLIVALMFSMAAISLPAADLLVGDTPGEVFTVAAGNTLDHTGTIWVYNDGILDIRGTLNLTGSIVILNTGQFIVDGGEFHLYGDNTNIIAGEQGRVIFRNGALWHYVQTYLSQHNLLCSGQAEVHVSDSTVDCDGSSEVIVMGDTSVYTGTNVISPDWKTWYLNDSTTLTLDNVNIGGDIVFTGSPTMSFTDTTGIMPWLYFGSGSVADLDFPDSFDPSTLVNLTIDDTTPGISGIGWRIAITDCYSVLLGVEPAPGSDVILRDSFVGMIKFTFADPAGETINGIMQNNTFYTDSTIPVSDRSLRLINSTVQWWKVDVWEGCDLTANDIIFSEMMIKHDSSVHLTNSICEGQTIHLGALDDSFALVENSEVWSYVSVWENAVMILRNSLVDFRKGEFIYQTRNIVHNNGRLYCLNTDFGYVGNPSESLPEAMDNGLAMYLYIDPPAALIDSMVDITGSAWIAKGPSCTAVFDHYELEVVADGSTLWNTIHSGTGPVDEAVLGTWDTAGLEPGLFTLRLTLYTSGDTAAELPEEYPAERIITLSAPPREKDDDDEGFLPGCLPGNSFSGADNEAAAGIGILLVIAGMWLILIKKGQPDEKKS